VLNLITIPKIKVIEATKIDNKLKRVYGLFNKHYVIAFFIWSAFHTFFHKIITHFLFWYMEDLVSKNNDDSQQAWLKTLQGITQGVQCFGSEIPFFFWSGWIINKLGHVNCMILVLSTLSIRMYLYTVIWNPVWIIFIELLNGVSFALGHSVKMSYAKIISPAHVTYSTIGLLGLTDHVGDSLGGLLGGYLFYSYGGVWSFRFFAFSSAFICLVNLFFNVIGLFKDFNNCTTVPMDIIKKDNLSIEN